MPHAEPVEDAARAGRHRDRSQASTRLRRGITERHGSTGPMERAGDRAAGPGDASPRQSLICSFTSLGRPSAARSKAATLSSNGNVSLTSGLRSTLPDAIIARARSNTLA